METQDISSLVIFAMALIAVGAGAGLVAGLLGVGGGIVIVPLLFQVLTMLGIELGTAMHVAVGTSLATIVINGMSSARAHYRKGSVDTALLRSWGPAIAVGAITGAAFAGLTRGTLLSALFACVALCVAVYMFWSRESTRETAAAPSGLAGTGIAGCVGLLSSMIGIGGGTLMVPILSASGYPIRRAVGTASAVGLIIAIPASLAFVITGWGTPDRPPFSLGNVNIVAIACIAPLGVLFAPIGARIAHGLPPRLLRWVFALFLVISATRMLYAALSG
ncbi:MAG: sulfite exporter TauE/SafE family protein [Hyphomonadaceae bacterium]|nr:sulfite exporter TauE/SafE family protein [Hyphomonadaceae bacterium]